MSKLLPLLLLLVGVAVGSGAGILMQPEVEVSNEMQEKETTVSMEELAELAKAASDDGIDREYVKLSNQFVIPVVEEGEVASLVVMSLSVEVTPGYRDGIFAREPKLRDSFLQVLFDHANVGGFRGSFTEANTLDVLRVALREVAIRDAGPEVTDVLILEIARQDY